MDFVASSAVEPALASFGTRRHTMIADSMKPRTTPPGRRVVKPRKYWSEKRSFGLPFRMFNIYSSNDAYSDGELRQPSCDVRYVPRYGCHFNQSH